MPGFAGGSRSQASAREASPGPDPREGDTLSPTRPDGATTRSPLRSRLRLALLGGLVLLSTTACSSSDLPRLGWATPAAEQTQRSLFLWQTLWITAFIVGGVTLILILFPTVFHRRSRMGEVPVQTRYNLPIEIFYTLVPLIIVAVVFAFTARDEAQITKLAASTPNTVNVVGFQWSWTFNYVNEGTYDVGTPTEEPTLWLPIGEKTRFELTSPDVIHSFWVPAFLFKMDVIPGRTNQFDLTPSRIGLFKGRCAELCGVDHSRMIFNVNVVSLADYQAHIAALKAAGHIGLLQNGRISDAAQGREGRTEIGHNQSQIYVGPPGVVGTPSAQSGSNP